ncbi:MAG: class I SAM-dependent methyltransferase [Verrucomicrobia bacterium]|nr:class I SAM-dependent methyltransferase [Verrucomicrobiota bacterium]
MSKKSGPARYDRAYFDRWYRDPKTRVKSGAAIRRKAALTLSVAEYYLERPVRTVLDVGCGEGNWFSALRTLRPKIRYTGVDASSYAVERFGKKRNIQLGSFAALEEIGLSEEYDLIVCSDTLFYLPLGELEQGIASLAHRAAGVAFLELYTNEDSLVGDFPKEGLQSRSFYMKMLARHGFLSVGSHCYLGPDMAERAMQMEKV